MRLKLALRNIFRHRGRTAVSLLMVASAVVALVLFMGFADYIISNTRRVTIDNNYGHIQVGQRAFWELAPGNRKNQLIPNADQLSQKLAVDPEVKGVSGRLSFFGLISTGDITVSAKGFGFDPVRETQFNKNLNMASGEKLQSDSEPQVIVGYGLQKKINTQVGSSVTVLAYTLDGVVNAMDFKVVGIFNTKNSEIDDNVFMMPLVTMQKLLDTDRVEVLSLRVDSTERTNAVRDRIQGIASRVDQNYQAKTWYELSNFYRQVEEFFISQNRIIQMILLSLVFLGILNTIGMSVYERTGEIGTVRALGETNRDVVMQFTLEGFLLGVMGAVIGAFLGVVATFFVSKSPMVLNLPGTSSPIPVQISMLPSAYLEAMIIVILAATIATWIPSIRASKMAIVEALKKNI